MKQLSEAEFDNKYLDKRIKNTIGDNGGYDGCMFETYGTELDFVIKMAKENRVITILEGEDDEDGNSVEYYVTGMHIVNRSGYFVLDEPLTEEFEVKIIWELD